MTTASMWVVGFLIVLVLAMIFAFKYRASGSGAGAESFSLRSSLLPGIDDLAKGDDFEESEKLRNAPPAPPLPESQTKDQGGA